jgi:predicted  nucleic acid-binding Zn-ribbon protein
MKPTDTLEILRRVNDSLRSALVRLHPERKHCSTISPKDFSDLRSQLQRAKKCLLRKPDLFEAAAEFERESLEYRSNLEKLKHFLPDVYGRLLAERSRLEAARTHVAAVASWASASKRGL